MLNQEKRVYKQATGLTKINENRLFVGLALSVGLERFDSLPPPPCDQACHLYMMSEMAKYICMQKDLLDHGGDTSQKSFLFPIRLIGEMVFSTQIYNLFFVVRKSTFEDNSRSNPTFISIEKIFIRILLSQFCRQSYVKPVRDPLHPGAKCAHEQGFLFVVTAAGVVPCGIPKKRPRTSSFEICRNILRNQKTLSVKIHIF